MSGQRINCLGDWIGRGGKDRNRAQETAWEALLSAAPPAARPASREAVASRIPSFGRRKGKPLGFRKNRSLEPTMLAQNLPLFDIIKSDPSGSHPYQSVILIPDPS